MKPQITLLITGGPGSGASSTGEMLSTALELPCIDSDDYFHKPSDPPFQAQYSKQERHQLLHREFSRFDSWILSGSISSWEINDVDFTHAVLLDLGPELRLRRLKVRERERFGSRLDEGGDMYDNHLEFMKWAASYESGELAGRNLRGEMAFIAKHCSHALTIKEALSLDELERTIVPFLGADRSR